MILKSNDIQPLVDMLRFLVAPLFKKEKRCKSLNFKEVQGFFISKNKQSKGINVKIWAHTEILRGLNFKHKY